MSGSPPVSTSALYDDELEAQDAPGTPVAPSSTSRTVAIIKTHALVHRFDIEPRIQETGFEIVKERQMEFDTETDPDTLYELFGDDTPSLAEGPVWVYVLERRRAVEVWKTLMGDADPEVARINAPNSLRAIYGISLEQNAVMGPPDDQTAEIQIASLFASSPPFPSTDLPEMGSPSRYSSIRSVSSSVLSALRKGSSDEGYAPSNPSTVNGSLRLANNGKPLFRARPIPATHATPTIQPRTTRAAALRAGVPVEKVTVAPRAPLTKERLAKTFANVPGHKRAETIPVASTAPPTVAPRMTRAASLRLGQQPLPAPRRRAITDPAKDAFEGVPGHKRRETISVASTAPPTVAPRLNRSAALRSQKDAAPPSSFMFRTAVEPKVPGSVRSLSQAGMTAPRPSLARPASAQSGIKTTTKRLSTAPVPRRAPAPRASTVTTSPPRTVPKAASVSPPLVRQAETAAKPKPRPSVQAPPTIAPRTNRSSLLRAAKLEAEASGKARKVPSARAVFA
jgi:nucleoside diphosphate kinase